MPRPRKRSKAELRQREVERKLRESGVKIHRKPYHVDLSRSLAEHRGWGPRGDDDGRGLRGRWASAAHSRLQSLDLRQLELLISQGADPDELHVLWPVIYARLEADICAAHGFGLLALMVGRSKFWLTHPHAREQLEQLIVAREQQLAESRDTKLAELARWFIEGG